MHWFLVQMENLSTLRTFYSFCRSFYLQIFIYTPPKKPFLQNNSSVSVCAPCCSALADSGWCGWWPCWCWQTGVTVNGGVAACHPCARVSHPSNICISHWCKVDTKQCDPMDFIQTYFGKNVILFSSAATYVIHQLLN